MVYKMYILIYLGVVLGEEVKHVRVKTHSHAVNTSIVQADNSDVNPANVAVATAIDAVKKWHALKGGTDEKVEQFLEGLQRGGGGNDETPSRLADMEPPANTGRSSIREKFEISLRDFRRNYEETETDRAILVREMFELLQITNERITPEHIQTILGVYDRSDDFPSAIATFDRDGKGYLSPMEFQRFLDVFVDLDYQEFKLYTSAAQDDELLSDLVEFHTLKQQTDAIGYAANIENARLLSIPRKKDTVREGMFPHGTAIEYISSKGLIIPGFVIYNPEKQTPDTYYLVFYLDTAGVIPEEKNYLKDEASKTKVSPRGTNDKIRKYLEINAALREPEFLQGYLTYEDFEDIVIPHIDAEADIRIDKIIVKVLKNIAAGGAESKVRFMPDGKYKLREPPGSVAGISTRQLTTAQVKLVLKLCHKCDDDLKEVLETLFSMPLTDTIEHWGMAGEIIQFEHFPNSPSAQRVSFAYRALVEGNLQTDVTTWLKNLVQADFDFIIKPTNIRPDLNLKDVLPPPPPGQHNTYWAYVIADELQWERVHTTGVRSVTFRSVNKYAGMRYFLKVPRMDGECQPDGPEREKQSLQDLNKIGFDHQDMFGERDGILRAVAVMPVNGPIEDFDSTKFHALMYDDMLKISLPAFCGEKTMTGMEWHPRCEDIFLYAYADATTLLDKVQESAGTGIAIPPQQVLQWTQELQNAVQYAHAIGWFHQDIKLDNIMVIDDRAVLIDFGEAERRRNPATSCDWLRLAQAIWLMLFAKEAADEMFWGDFYSCQERDSLIALAYHPQISFVHVNMQNHVQEIESLSEQYEDGETRDTLVTLAAQFVHLHNLAGIEYPPPDGLIGILEEAYPEHKARIEETYTEEKHILNHEELDGHGHWKSKPQFSLWDWRSAYNNQQEQLLTEFKQRCMRGERMDAFEFFMELSNVRYTGKVDMGGHYVYTFELIFRYEGHIFLANPEIRYSTLIDEYKLDALPDFPKKRTMSSALDKAIERDEYIRRKFQNVYALERNENKAWSRVFNSEVRKANCPRSFEISN